MDSFVHLEVHSAFSFLWGTFTPEQLVEKVVSLGQEAVALTDYGLHGAARFCRAATSAGIQPIVGARVLLWDGSLVTFLATSYRGYANLCKLVSRSLREDMIPRFPLTKQDVAHWSGDLVCLAGGWDSRVLSLLHRRGSDAAGLCINELREVLVRPEWLFLVMQNHQPPRNVTFPPDRHSEASMAKIAKLARELRVSLVASGNAVFLEPADYRVHKALVGIQQRHHHRNVRPLPTDQFYLASSREMERRIPNPEALANTSHVAALCRNFTLPLGRLHPPSFQEAGKASQSLTRLCFRELATRHRPVPSRYIRALDRELEVIIRRQLADFFLLVREVVEYARAGNIRHSVRGSAAASLVVSLLLGGVDPVAHNLLFERFINDGRSDLPDVDIDFDSMRRDEVLHYLIEHFPRQAAMVSTIHTFKVRSAVRLAARALGYSLPEIKRLSTCLPWSLRGRNLLEALAHLPELRDSPLKKEPELVELAARLTGLPFQCSVHLGGMLLAPGDITDWTPVGVSPKGFPVGQLDKDDAEAMGLLKLDLLGLRMHTAIRKTLETLKAQGIHVEPDKVPLNDRKTYALLRSTESLGVFQVESPGQRNLLGRLQPRRFSDLIAEISLFRTGPVEGNMVDTYVQRRNGEEPVQIPHPSLVPVLTETYGVILFQEQVLRIVHVFAGLSYAEADAFRRAMTKDRRSKKLAELKANFFAGALSKGHSRAVIEEVFEGVAAFASYGFCKAHAASFAHITYQSAYLKAHHPQAFYLGLLNAGHVGSYPPSTLLNEARRRGIAVYSPHVNASEAAYEAEGSGIRVPLDVIHGVGPAVARRVLAERSRRGAFRSMTDFVMRMSLPDSMVEKLSLAGAMNGLDNNEWQLISEVYHV